MENRKCDTHHWNRYIEYFDFHFSRVLCSTEMAHLRLLGIRRIGLFFSITVSHFGLLKWCIFISFFSFIFSIVWCVVCGLLRGAHCIVRIHFDKTHNSKCKACGKFIVCSFTVFSFFLLLFILSLCFFFCMRFAWEQKHFYNVIYNGNILYENSFVCRARVDWVILILNTPLKSHIVCIWNVMK